MKRYEITCHFNNVDGDVVGVYLFDSEAQKGFPVWMPEFKELVMSSQVMFLEWQNGEMVYVLSEEEQNALKDVPGFFAAAERFASSVSEFWNADAWADECNYGLFEQGALPVTVLPVMDIPKAGKIFSLDVSGRVEDLQKIKADLGKLGEICQITKVFSQSSMLITIPWTEFGAKKGTLESGLKDCVFCFPPLGAAVRDLRNHFNLRWKSGAEVIAGIPNDVLKMFVLMNDSKMKETGADSAQTAVIDMF